jgi:hypothetical protein
LYFAPSRQIKPVFRIDILFYHYQLNFTESSPQPSATSPIQGTASMQNDTSLYEIPADRMVFTHERLASGRELGKAEIVSTFWGKAKIRIVDEQGNSRTSWTLPVAGVLALIVVGATWHYFATTKNGVASSPAIAQPDAPKIPAENSMLQNTSPTQNAPAQPASVPAAATPQTVMAVAAPKPALVESSKPKAAAEATSPTIGARKKSDLPLHTQPQSPLAAKADKTPTPAAIATEVRLPKSPESPKSQEQPKPQENSVRSANLPVAANSAASAKTDAPASPTSTSAEPAKNQAADTKPQ